MHSFCVLSKRVFVQLSVKFSFLLLLEGVWDHLCFSLRETKTRLSRQGEVNFFSPGFCFGTDETCTGNCFKIAYHINIICKKISFPSTGPIFISDV